MCIRDSPPTSVKAIGHTDQANHQYDLTSFDAALAAGNLPAVSFLSLIHISEPTRLNGESRLPSYA